MKKNLIFNKKAKVLLLCLVILIILIKVNINKINISNLTASLLNSSSSKVVVEDLGIQFQQLGSGPGSMFFDANGDPHWFVVFSGRAQFIDVNLKTGEKRYFNTGKGGLGGSPKALSGNKLFVFVGDACSVWEYDITLAKIKELKQTGSNNGCGNSTGTQSAYTAPDGMVYAGTAHRSTVYEIDPSTGKIRDFGIIDPPAGNPTCNGCPSRQIANIAADTKYVYTLVRDTGTNSYWLAIINRTDGSLSASCNKDDKINSGRVVSSLDGTQIWYNSYRVDNTGGKCPTVKGNPPKLKSWFFPSKVYSTDGDAYAQAASVFGVDIDASKIEVDSSSGGVATLSYRYPAGSGTWKQINQSILMLDSKIKRIVAKDNTSAYLISGTYGPNSVFNGTSNTMLGRVGGQSIYAATLAGKYVYFSGYTATTYRYDPSSPWSITGTGTNCRVSSPSNPCLAFAGMGKYHYYSKVAKNGNLYISSDYKRGNRGGGDIGWINPTTGATGSYGLTCDAPAGFALFSDGETIAYSGSGESGSFGCTNTVGKVFIFNTNTNTLIRSFTPVAGSDSQGTIIDTNDGGILGIVGGYPNVGTYTMYKVDANGKHASWSPMVVTGKIFGSTNGADKFFIKARDGMIYTVGDNTEIIKINPNDGSRSTFLKSSTYITAMEFVGDDLYIATGSNTSNLKRIKGINPSNTPTLSSEKAITSFGFMALSPNVTGLVDTVNGTISLTVPFGTNVKSIIPTITITGASISPKTGVSKNFTNPVSYIVTAQDGSKQTYKATVTIAPKTPIVEKEKPKTTTDTPLPKSDTLKTETPKKATETQTPTQKVITETPTVVPPTTPLSADRYITYFGFNSLSPIVKGVFNEGGTLTVTVPANTNITSLVPTISFKGASIVPSSGVAQNFTTPVKYTVTAANGLKREYVVTVKIAS
jgi:hypothetical protein